MIFWITYDVMKIASGHNYKAICLFIAKLTCYTPDPSEMMEVMASISKRLAKKVTLNLFNPQLKLHVKPPIEVLFHLSVH